MTLYPASDYQSLGAVQGCDEEHRRPHDPKTGRPVHPWAVECAAHEAHYMGYGRPRVLKYITDPKTGQVTSQQRVLDSHPGFSTTADSIPLTYDEVRTDAIRRERGRAQIEMLQALSALRSTGVSVPAEAMYLLEKELPAGVLHGTVVCLNGHDVPSGSGFCPQCGVSMSARGAIGGGDEEPAVDLGLLHVATLRKRCRDAGLPDKGSRDVLIGRLQAA